MKNFSILLSTVAIILAAVATIKTYKTTDGAVSSDFAVEVAEALKSNPQMIVDAMQKYQEDMRAAEEKAAQEAMAKYIDEINSSANAPFVGPEDAKVVVVEFFDFSCGYCKRLAPELEKVVADNKDVKFIFKPLTFVAPGLSAYQAKAAYAADKQGKFSEFYKEVMGFAGRMTEANVDEVAKKVGLDVAKYKADLASDEVAANMKAVSELAQNISISGVPAVLVNGKPVMAMRANELQNAIDAAK